MSKPYAKKSLGQNFLVDQDYIEKIIKALDLKEDEQIIEIGAGRGALTEKLLEKEIHLTAIELDRDLVPFLLEKFSHQPNFEVIEQNALTVDFTNLVENSQNLTGKAKLVANLPYNISTAILQHLIQYRGRFSEMILMLQKEVVDRITARPGEKKRGYLTVLIEAFFRSEKLFDVPPQAFRPIPKVWSSVVRLITKVSVEDDGLEISKDEKLFKDLISAGFAQKRKTLLNNLKNVSPVLSEQILNPELILENAGIDLKRRAETLTFKEWKRILKIIKPKSAE